MELNRPTQFSFGKNSGHASIENAFSSRDALLRWSIEHSDPNELKKAAESIKSGENIDPSKKLDPKWIDAILGKPDSEIIKDIIKSLKLYNNKFYNPCDNVKEENVKDMTDKDRIEALVDLEYLIETIDNAVDFAKMGGIDIIMSVLLNDSCNEVRCAAANVLIVCIQNNPFAQKTFINGTQSRIKNLINRISLEEDIATKVKIVGCLCALLRDNDIDTTNQDNNQDNNNGIIRIKTNNSISIKNSKKKKKRNKKEKVTSKNIEEKKKVDIGIGIIAKRQFFQYNGVQHILSLLKPPSSFTPHYLRLFKRAFQLLYELLQTKDKNYLFKDNDQFSFSLNCSKILSQSNFGSDIFITLFRYVLSLLVISNNYTNTNTLSQIISLPEHLQLTNINSSEIQHTLQQSHLLDLYEQSLLLFNIYIKQSNQYNMSDLNNSNQSNYLKSYIELSCLVLKYLIEKEKTDDDNDNFSSYLSSLLQLTEDTFTTLKIQ